ncbi:glycerophosphoinositol inositolphosphodiesterase GDPD2 [Chanos chanos]|uniref:Glycerophosphoinositol inositolphosphodiesterase GDPD2 n=1 Tax=Chanos chanos TaxID=29144 RepID=A0A6J2UQ66_CHACN|nr:glycerophosphoinositol inositolphosphodiesterase GDPD2 [Chanos chanos]
MSRRESPCRICFRGIYSCHWRRARRSEPKCPCCWFTALSVAAVLTLIWMYICFVAFNDQNDVNWKGFKILGMWVDWYFILIILSAVLASYCLLLLLFALFQLALREPLDLHWLHKVLLFLGSVIVVLGIVGIIFQWKEVLPTIPLSLQATAPFLHLGVIVALTLISWLVFRSYHRAKRTVSKVLIMVAFIGVSVAVFLCPLLIRSPCLIDTLPQKPALVGHRGAPMLAPENTMMSFRKSMECDVTAFETDVLLSKDNVSFLMHDHDSKFLRRTTNIGLNESGESTDYYWRDLKKLNAGEWFLKMDPFRSLSSLSEADKDEARNQIIPSLNDLLNLAKNNNISLIFDMKNATENNSHVHHTVQTILDSNISQDLIWWLPPVDRDHVKIAAPGFRQVYTNVSQMEVSGGNFLNMKYSALSTEEIRNLRSRNISVNLWTVNERWLFSLAWCSGVSSVTTNACHLLKDMSKPDWHLRPTLYRNIWISADIVSLLFMCIFFLLQWSLDSSIKSQQSPLMTERASRRLRAMKKGTGSALLPPLDDTMYCLPSHQPLE